MNLKNIFKKENTMPVIVLGVICLVVAALLGVVNMITAPVIETAEKEAVSESLRVVMPNGLFSESEELPADAPETVTAIYKDENGGGHVVTLETTKGYTGQAIAITVGIDTAGKITGAVVTKNPETKITAEMEAFPAKFSGLDAAGVEGVELVSGVTYSSRAVKNAIIDALVVLGYAEASTEEETVDNSGVSVKTDAEIESLAKELIGSDELETVTFDGAPTAAKRIFRDKGGKGYVIHIVTRTEWVPNETEGLVAVNNLGTVTDISFINWTVGHDVPVTDEYIESFNGKHKDSLNRVELVTGATRTAANFRDALEGTLDVMFPVPVYTVITAVVLAVLAACAIAAVVVIKYKRRRNG